MGCTVCAHSKTQHVCTACLQVVPEGTGPEERAHFTATKFGNRIFIFGGYGGSGQVYNDMWVLHFAESEGTRQHVRRYLDRDEHVSGHDVVWGLIRLTMLSVGHTAIVPFQDILALDGGARMNLPGEADGNWSWRVRIEAFHEHLSNRLRPLVELGDRLPKAPTPS